MMSAISAMAYLSLWRMGTTFVRTLASVFLALKPLVKPSQEQREREWIVSQLRRREPVSQSEKVIACVFYPKP